MPKKILVLTGHPHDAPSHLCHALANAYATGARESGHSVTQLDIAKMSFDPLRDPADFSSDPPPDVRAAQKATLEAHHLVIFYPLWLGAMPARTKAFFEQFARNEFALATSEKGGWPRKMLKGRSAHVVVTMGMPAAAYRVFFGAHGVKSFESGILAMAGFRPIRDTLVGGVSDKLSEKAAERHFERMRGLGRRAA